MKAFEITAVANGVQHIFAASDHENKEQALDALMTEAASRGDELADIKVVEVPFEEKDGVKTWLSDHLGTVTLSPCKNENGDDAIKIQLESETLAKYYNEVSEVLTPKEGVTAEYIISLFDTQKALGMATDMAKKASENAINLRFISAIAESLKDENCNCEVCQAERAKQS